MDWLGLVINLVAIASGLAIYIVISRSKWGREHEEYQYAIMLFSVLGACVAGGLLRLI